MKGLSLRSLSGELHRVAPEFELEPVMAIQEVERKLGAWGHRFQEEFEREFSLPVDGHRLPLQAFEGFSFDELCKIRYSSGTMMDSSVDNLFQKNARYEVVRKIQNSMWRWDISKGTWNEIVDAYNCIRNFSLNLEGFEIRLDHATYFNEYGSAKYSRVFLDGTFAYLIYYKRRHVLTVGFSLLSNRRLLIQQVQSATQTGNRGLYKLPSNRLEFFIEQFAAQFPGYSLAIIDGKCLVEKTLADYKRSLERIKRREGISSTGLDAMKFQKKVRHLKDDSNRLIGFYSNTGRFLRCEPFTKLGLRHHHLVAT